MGAMAQWFALQEDYPPTDEAPRLVLRARSGAIGPLSLLRVRYNGCVTLAACASGLRVSVWRVFAPLQRPFEVPWTDIDARPATGLFWRSVELKLGRPEITTLVISASIWQRICAEVQEATIHAR